MFKRQQNNSTQLQFPRKFFQPLPELNIYMIMQANESENLAWKHTENKQYGDHKGFKMQFLFKKGSIFLPPPTKVEGMDGKCWHENGLTKIINV